MSPVHVHPIFRAQEEAEEAAGLINKLDSVGVTIQKNLETQGATFRQSPKETILVNGTSFTPAQIPVGS